ncbi:sugar phosphate isomerase/epimerase [Verrucomicrobia bacterium LW23]|nr:sugar phosphate isomerase/epimerase [Verrucomicrobia bacterium LW23]
MFDLSNQLGIKTFSFRHITDNAEVAAAVKRCGVSSIDISGTHINYDDVDQQEKAIATYRNAGVAITGNGVVYVKNDEAFARRFFEFAKRAGSDCDVVSCSFEPQDHLQVLAMLDRLAEEYGKRVAIHNHGGYNWLGSSAALKYVLANSSERVGICIDTAWCLQAGEDPLKWLELFGQRLYGIHFKDFTFTPKGKWQDTIIGEGSLDLPVFLEKFLALPFNGSAVVEFEGPDAVEQTAKCIAALRAKLPVAAAV